MKHEKGIQEQIVRWMAAKILGEPLAAGEERALGMWLAESEELFAHPRHPYTQGLIASLPHLGMRPMAGFSPAFTHQPAGCVFHPRCPHAQERCRLEEPGELCLGEGRVACHGCT